LTAGLATFGATTEPVVVDLSQPASAREVQEVVAEHSVVPVNDTGVGGHGRSATERQLATDLAIIQLNITTLVELTGLLLLGMVNRHRGGILNVASIAGYLPRPWAGGVQRQQGVREVVQSAPQRGDAQHRRTRDGAVPWPGCDEFDSVASRTAIRQGVLLHQKCAKGGPTGPQARFPTGGPQTGGWPGPPR
jgi:NAD(P)-dependent dehydrogenase (short-subunit alcohol dehydrogenase family)